MELETQLAEGKAELRAQKENVRVMVEEMDKMSRDLAKREIYFDHFLLLLLLLLLN